MVVVLVVLFHTCLTLATSSPAKLSTLEKIQVILINTDT